MYEKIRILDKKISINGPLGFFLGPLISIETKRGSRINRKYLRDNLNNSGGYVIVNGQLVNSIRETHRNDNFVKYEAEVVTPINFWARWNFIKTYSKVVLEQIGLK